MKIGIIGAGNIGGTLTRRLTALGHEVLVANSRGPETLADLAAETGADAVSVPEAVRGVDLVIVTIPQKNVPDLPAGLFAGAGRRAWSSSTPATTTRGSATAASTGSRRACRRAAGSSSSSAGRWSRRSTTSLPSTCWSAAGRGHPRAHRPAGRGRRRRGKAVVLRLLDELGFDGVDAGGLDESWRQQPGTPVYATDFDADGVRRALAAAPPERPPAWRATPA